MQLLRFFAGQNPTTYASLSDLLSALLSGFVGETTWVNRIVLLAGAVLLAALTYVVVRQIFVRGVERFARTTETEWDNILVQQHFFRRVVRLFPALVLYFAAPLILPEPQFHAPIQQVLLSAMVLIGAFAAHSFLGALVEIYEQSFRKGRSIRSYVQVFQLFLWAMAGILAIAALMDRSPWALLGGLGAMTAMLMLVFKDAILGLVASIQLTTNDMVRLGDWIEMPQYGADGNVEEIMLTTVKVRNWDMTITTIPTYKLLADAFKNWRGMSESGVRRIRRAVLIDVGSVRFVDEKMLEEFKKIHLLKEHLARKVEEMQQWNAEQEIDESSLVNGRRLTNLGCFRAYLEAYLRSHPAADHSQTLMVHQKAPTERGLELQLYFFSTEQRWAYWEAIQADIFDHVFAIASEFDLRMVQIPTSADLRMMVGDQKP